jgi:hypothetical protein
MGSWTANSDAKLRGPLPFEARRQPEPAARSTSAAPSKSSPLKLALNDWLDGVVEGTREKYQEQRVQEEKVLQEEILIGRFSSQFCRDLFEWFEGIDERFNSRFGGHVLSVSILGTDGDRSVQVLARPVRSQERIAVLNYQKETKSVGLHMNCGSSAKPAEEIRLVLFAESAVVAEIGEEHYTPEQLGRKVIEDLLA